MITNVEYNALAQNILTGNQNLLISINPYQKGLTKVSKSKVDKLVIAYEPVWAIGTGKSCKPVEAQVVNFMIRKILTRIYDRSTAQSVRVIYGGSVDREKASTFLKETEMKGVLIGGVSLDSVEFIKIVKDVESF